MIKTKINRHDLEYFVYAMVKAFYKEAEVLAPDTALHNMAKDSVGENEDLLVLNIEEQTFTVCFHKGQWFYKDHALRYDIHIDTVSLKDETKLKSGNAELKAGTDFSDTQLKDEIRGYIYDSLVEYTQRELPWGNLTGIRPTKLYLQKLINNASENAIDIESSENINAVTQYMKNKYRVTDDKNILGAGIALRENKIINSVHCRDGYSLYIGIPFCPSTCLYCSFTSNPIYSYRDMIDDYIEAVIKEIKATKELMKDYHLDTVYIGGGTPTTLEPDKLEVLLNAIENILPMEEVMEFTVEAGRADSITEEKLKVLMKHNVTRISVNPQTMNDKTLKLIGRHHTVDMVRETFLLARRIGFNNINMDMILGLPGENIEDVEYTLAEIKKLSPESLTVHSLAIKRASRMKEYMESHDISCDMDFDTAMRLSEKNAEEMGLLPYYLYRQKDMAGNLENTGFAKEGMFGIYNIVMMEEVQTIVACGAGTVTKRVFPDGRIERCDNVKDVNLYISKIEEMIDRKRELFAD